MVVAAFNHPRLPHDVPHGQVPPLHLEGHRGRLSRRQANLLEPAELLGRRTGDADIQLSDLLAKDVARVGDLGRRGEGHLPLVLAVAGGGGGQRLPGEMDTERGVAKSGVRQAEAELKARGDVPGVEAAVVEVRALGEVALGVNVLVVGAAAGVQHGAIIALVAGDGVGHAAREVGAVVAVEQAHEGLAAVLAREEGDDGGGDVGVLDPLVDEPSAAGVHDDDGVGALGGHVEDETVGVVVAEAGPVPAFGCDGVDEDEAGVGGGVDVGVERSQVPVYPGAVLGCPVLDGAQGLCV